MKYFLPLIFTLSTTSAFAKCSVFVPEKYFYNSGLEIRFDFFALFEAKGYKETVYVGEADYELRVSGEEVETTFHKAKAIYDFVDLKTQKSMLTIVQSKTCYTQYCSMSDYRNSFSKGYKELQKKFPKCN